ncbi:MAG: alpha-ketoglutarate-dependent dioxygenase AlkB, partial [Motiliproteus sp.]|nr:alpha-ketoglutarate-dependent dioxygenase AlkB [Motiliproteus sp.]
DTLKWQQDNIRMFGRSVAIPRLQAWYGDKGCSYTYSGLQMKPHAWDPLLKDIKAQVEHHCHQQFNAVLANLYRHGQDSMGWHCDNEPELGTKPILASVTLGAERRFCLRHKGDKSHNFELCLQHGSLLLMAGATQQHWLHSIPKKKGLQAPRINLTFRQVLVEKSS